MSLSPFCLHDSSPRTFVVLWYSTTTCVCSQPEEQSHLLDMSSLKPPFIAESTWFLRICLVAKFDFKCSSPKKSGNCLSGPSWVHLNIGRVHVSKVSFKFKSIHSFHFIGLNTNSYFLSSVPSRFQEPGHANVEHLFPSFTSEIFGSRTVR